MQFFTKDALTAHSRWVTMALVGGNSALRGEEMWCALPGSRCARACGFRPPVSAVTRRWDLGTDVTNRPGTMVLGRFVA